MKKSDRIYVAGKNGLAGSAIWKKLEQTGHENLFGYSSKDLDLKNRQDVFDALNTLKPDVVIDAAARVGGIHANSTYPADFLSENIQIQVNLMDAALNAGVNRFLFLGSSCIYPRLAPQPISEDALLTGKLEETNSAYGIAKIAGILHVQAIRSQYGKSWISAMPINLYGPNDNYHPENSHVLAALIRRFHDAKVENLELVTVWGTGTPLREFMHSEDLAEACVFLLNNYDDPTPINIGSGEDISIRDLAYLIAEVVGYQGEIRFDSSRPDGTPRKLLDNSRIYALGWKPRWTLKEGILDAYGWFLENQSAIRSI